MADPISSLTCSDSTNSCIDTDGDAGAMSVAPAQTSAPPVVVPEGTPTTATPSAVPSLVARFKATPALAVDTNAKTEGPVPGAGSYRITQSALKVEVQSGLFKGSALEVGTVSATAGQDHDVQVSLLKKTFVMTHGAYSLTVSDDIGSFRANKGAHNDDGSVGGNLGLAGDLAGVEGNLSTPFGSVTLGDSASAGASGSLGVRDADHDGKPEFCEKFSIPAYTVGVCVEQFW